MTSRPGTGAAPAIHRNVVLHELPHPLSRPRRMPAQAEPLPPQAPPPRSYEEGYRDGRAQAAADALAAAEQREQQQSAAREAALRDAVAAGHAEGLRQAQVQAAVELEQHRERAQAEADAAVRECADEFDRLARSLRSQAHEMVMGAEDDLVELSFEAVCRILAERAVEPEAVRTMVRELVDRHFRTSVVRAHVHPLDHELLMRAAPPAAEGWTWVADPGVALGGVMLHTDRGSLDATLEAQLEQLARVLLEVRDARRKQGAQGSGATP